MNAINFQAEEDNREDEDVQYDDHSGPQQWQVRFSNSKARPIKLKQTFSFCLFQKPGDFPVDIFGPPMIVDIDLPYVVIRVNEICYHRKPYRSR